MTVAFTIIIKSWLFFLFICYLDNYSLSDDAYLLRMNSHQLNINSLLKLNTFCVSGPLFTVMQCKLVKHIIGALIGVKGEKNKSRGITIILWQ